MARAKGTPKTGGRIKGVPNKATREIKEIAQKHGKAAIDKLVALMNGSDDDRVQAAAANSLLDRGYGKAVQAHTGEGGEGAIKVVVEHVNID